MFNLALGPSQFLLKWVVLVMSVGQWLLGTEADH